MRCSADRRACAILMVLMLAACGRQAQPVDRSQVQATDHRFQSLALDSQPLPGQYAGTMVVTKMPVGAPVRVEESRSDHCLKDGPDAVRREVTEKSDRMCIGPPLAFADGRISGARQCFWSSSATERLAMQFDGSYERDRIELIVTATAPEGSVRWVRTLTRTGQCLSNREAIADAIARNDWSIADNTHGPEPHAAR